MATKDTDHSIPKENKDSGIENSESAESEAARKKEENSAELKKHLEPNNFNKVEKFIFDNKDFEYKSEQINFTNHQYPNYIKQNESKPYLINFMQPRSHKLRDKRDIIIWHKNDDRDGVHMLRERIQRLWNREVQGNNIAIDLEMEAAVGFTEMAFDTTLFDVYRIILVYVTQSFDAHVHRRFRMESILKDNHRRGGNLSRRVIPLWVDVEPGHSHHIQLNILQGLSADSDTEINNLLRLLSFDSE